MHKMKVDKSHYSFTNYINKNCWLSIWHQADEVLGLNPNPSTVLEIGPGPMEYSRLCSNTMVFLWKP